MLVHARIAGVFVLLVGVSTALHGTVHYTLTLSDPVRHLVSVSMEIPAGSDARELQLPVWNALYQIRDFVQYMNSIRASDLAGTSLPLTQLNKSRWRLNGAGKGARVEYQMLANDPGPYGAQLNPQHAFFNLAELLLYADDTRSEDADIAFQALPAGWRIATTLANGGSRFKARNYDALVDAPVEIGTFQETDFEAPCGHYRVVVDASDAASILPRIVPPIQKIVSAATAWMDDCPFQTYTFIYHFSDDASGGGMEHAEGTVINMPREQIENDLGPFTSVTAHEFFHLWNVKRIRPQSLEPVDYTRENYTTALWFSEGVDSAVGDLIRLKAGLLDETRYLYRLSQGIRELQGRPAHLTQSVEQASLGAWLEKYPYYGAPDRSISYYNKGELLGVLIDLRMREITHGKASLQSVLRWMNTHEARQEKFFADSEGVREAVETLTGGDFREFFSDYVSGTREIPWDNFFASVGLHVVTSDLSYADPGFDTVQKFDRPTAIIRVSPGSAAEKAGVKADDEIVAVNGVRVVQDFNREIEKGGPGSTIRLKVRRDGEPLEFQLKLAEGHIKFYELRDVSSMSKEQRRARKEWLSGVAGNSPQ